MNPECRFRLTWKCTGLCRGKSGSTDRNVDWLLALLAIRTYGVTCARVYEMESALWQTVLRNLRLFKNIIGLLKILYFFGINDFLT